MTTSNPARPLARTSTLLAALLLTGCGTTLTVDDGRPLDPKLLAEMRAYGAAVKVLRPAIVRSAAVRDPDCSKQYELPFDAWSSAGIGKKDYRIGWLRTLGLSEDFSILAADAGSGLAPGEVIAGVGGYTSRMPLKLSNELTGLRDKGKPFRLLLRSGREVTVTPLEVCRGRSTPALPLEAANQSYHWSATSHPQALFDAALTPDETSWIVLWTQGLSEVGGARMKTYSYAVGTVKWTALAALSVASGGAMAAAGGAAAAGGVGMGTLATQVVAISAARQVAQGLTNAALNRASLSGVNGIAAGVFDQADAWAFDKARRIGVDPRAGLSLSGKLLERGLTANAFALDAERLAKLQALAASLLAPAVAQAGPEAAETFRVPDPAQDANDEAAATASPPAPAAEDARPRDPGAALPAA